MWALHAERHVVHPTSRRRSPQHAAARAVHLTSRSRAYQRRWRLSVSDGRQSQNGNSQTRLIMIKSR